MRLFYALRPTDSALDNLIYIQDTLANQFTQGRFLARNLLHCTLVFLGDKKEQDLPSLEGILNQLPATPRFLIPSVLTSFHSAKGRTVVLTLKKNTELMELQKKLSQLLIHQEHHLEKRAFHPHITLAKHVFVPTDWQEHLFPNEPLAVHSLALLNSKMDQQGLLHYQILSEIRTKP